MGNNSKNTIKPMKNLIRNTNLMHKLNVNKLTMNKLTVSKLSLNKRMYSIYTPKQKDPRFSSLTQGHIQYFRSLFKSPDSQVLYSSEDLDRYNQDWTKQIKGHSKLVLRCKSTEEVSKVLAYCNQEHLPVIVQGGNTGLVMGSVPVFDEIILSMELMNQIESFDETSGSLVCQAGCVLEQVNQYVEERGFTFPLDLGAKGSCQIGGNLSTNAGGVRYGRYKSLHANMLGLEVVLADGSIISELKTIRKDNTGLHLNHLFLGSEGILGVITRASINCPPASKSVQVLLLGLESFNQITSVYKLAREQLGEILSAFEFFDQDGMSLVLRIFGESGIRNPIQNNNFFLLLEIRGSNTEHDQEKLNMFLDKATKLGLIIDGTVASSPKEVKDIWAIREHITLALNKSCKPGEIVYKYDLGIPLPQIYDLVDIMKEKLQSKASTVIGYGHASDDNLHLNIVGPKTDEFLGEIEPFVYEWISERNGSISAEHGIGRLKPQMLHLSKSKISIEKMIKIKELFDPNGILAPYKVLPSPQL